MREHEGRSSLELDSSPSFLCENLFYHKESFRPPVAGINLIYSTIRFTVDIPHLFFDQNNNSIWRTLEEKRNEQRLSALLLLIVWTLLYILTMYVTHTLSLVECTEEERWRKGDDFLGVVFLGSRCRGTLFLPFFLF